MNLADLLVIPAEMFPDQEILRFEGTATTYAGFVERVGRMAAALDAAGAGRGSRVALLDTNTPGALATVFASAAVGSAVVPLNFRARGEELMGLLTAAAPSLVVVGDRYLATMSELGGQLAAAPPVLVYASLETTVDPGPVLEVSDVSSDDIAVLMFTSGTISRPKVVRLRHDSLVGYVLDTTEPADGSSRGSVLLCAPLHHIAGLTALLAAVFAGRRVVLMRQFESAEWLRLAETEGVTHAFVVPTMLRRLLDDPAFVTTDLRSLEVLSYGAAPMSPSLIRRAIDLFPSTTQFVNAFGQTETTSTVTMLTPDDHRLSGTPDDVDKKLRRLGSIGRPLPDVDLRVVDADGRQLGSGEVGEIIVRTDRLMAGYDGQEAETRAALRDGWLWTRDLGWIDDDGYVFLAGRVSDLIIRGGENISPDEIEVVLCSHPAVDDAAVVGIPDDEWGEHVEAAVVLRLGETVNEAMLIEFCRAHLASFKKPERIVFVNELPRTALGKLRRRDVRALLAREEETKEVK